MRTSGSRPTWVFFLSFLAIICVTLSGLIAKSASRGYRALMLDSLAYRIEADLSVFDRATRDPAARTSREMPAPTSGDVSARTSRDTNGMIQVRIPEHPLTASHMSFINVLNEAGDVVASSRTNVSRSANFAGRDYFFRPPEKPIRRPVDRPPLRAVQPSRRGNPADTAPERPERRLRRSRCRRYPSGLAVRHASHRMTIRQADGVILATAPFDPDAIGRTAAATGDAALTRSIAGGLLILEAGASPGIIWLPPGHHRPARARLPVPRPPPLPAPPASARIATWAAHDQEARSHLMATMSREPRPPLTGVIGQADLLRDEGGLTGGQSKRLARPREAAARMHDVSIG
jgi:hypothetical protein